MVGGTRPFMAATDNEIMSSIRERHAKNRVQFNLGPSSASARNINVTPFRQIPEQLKTHNRDFVQRNVTPNLLRPNRIQLTGNQPRALPTTSQLQNSEDLKVTNALISQLAQPTESQPSRANFNRQANDPPESLTQLVPKSKMKHTALNRRNLSKVSYTYQAVIRPSSPSYMASTSASRNRSSNSSKSGVQRNNSKTGSIRSSTNRRNKVSGVGSSSSQSSQSGLILKSSTSNKSLGHKSRGSKKGKRRSRFKLSTSHHDMGHLTSTVSVVLKEKFLMKIFSHLSWNELLAVRSTCKKWYEIISTEAPLKKEGVIILRRNLEGMAIFNKSLYVWTQFRIFVSVVFDFTDAMQQEFWSKHGKTMSYLEIRNSSMTLSALVEILSRCPNLEHFSVTWTAEMYSFNSEMIKKYYGIHFRNGTFVKLHELTIDKSYFLTDNALWSLLKWCGGSIHKLALTCGPEDHEDTLSRLKPRWSIEPIQNYTSRFGYSGNFKFLDFSGSNLNSEDLKTLARTEKLNSLAGIRLSNCKINDESIGFFIEKKGLNLEELFIDNTVITEKALEGATKLPKLRNLNISGKKGNFHNLEFLPYLRSLEEFHCSDTTWLTYTTLAKPLEAFGAKSPIRKLDISSSNNIISRVDQRMNKIWFSHLSTIVPKLVEINLNFCGNFGNDDNFKAICTNIPTMEKLAVREWTSLTDEALVGMTFDDIIKQYDDVRGFWKTMDTPLKFSPVICNLKNLKYLDLGGCKKLTDVCVQFAIIHLPRLSKLSLDKSQVTDASFNLLLSKSSRLEKFSVDKEFPHFRNKEESAYWSF
ncbi:unnamed protein product [Allacma fusca]|uniref:F-box domain-containing protein n=1 Tax=Allacma fusca TaxID=39272 RepID=A0A8J2NJJ9_9HEXA|nr:unnamed protein product [Allacma fusca]